MESLNLSSAEIVRLLVVAVVLLVGLGFLKWVLKATIKMVALGCLGTVVVVGILLVLALTS